MAATAGIRSFSATAPTAASRPYACSTTAATHWNSNAWQNLERCERPALTRVFRSTRLLPPVPRRQAVQPVRTDRYPHQAGARQADGGAHAPHLPVAAFLDGQFDPGVRHAFAETH